MDKFIEYYNRDNNKSDNTIKTFKQSIKRIEKILKKPFDKWNKKILTPSITNDVANISSKIQILTTLNRYYEYNKWDNKNIKKELNKYVLERTKKDKSQEKTDKEKENWIDYDELYDKVLKYAEEYKKGDKIFSRYRNFLMLCLFVLQPPARISNYLNMLYKIEKKRDVMNLQKKYNYITKIDNKYKFVFNNYKTSKYLGQQVNIVENETLNKLLDVWFNYYNTDKKYFLINYNGESINQSNFSNGLKSITKKLFNKDITLNMLRHIFLTNYMSKKHSIKEKEMLTRQMGQKYLSSRAELYVRYHKKKENEDK